MQGESACADYTLIHETTHPAHLRLLRSDCPCSRQRATPPTKNTSKHGPTPTGSLLPTSGIQKQPAVQTALLNTTTNHSNSSAYSGVTANAVINEQLSGPNAQPSKSLNSWRCKKNLPLQTATRTPGRFREKRSTKSKTSKGDAQVEIPKGLPGKTPTEARQG